jgi:hypothetical protein
MTPEHLFNRITVLANEKRISLNTDQKVPKSKNYNFVPLPLPTRYHFRAIVTHGDTPSIIVTLPFLTAPHCLSPLKITFQPFLMLLFKYNKIINSLKGKI